MEGSTNAGCPWLASVPLPDRPSKAGGVFCREMSMYLFHFFGDSALVSCGYSTGFLVPEHALAFRNMGYTSYNLFPGTRLSFQPDEPGNSELLGAALAPDEGYFLLSSKGQPSMCDHAIYSDFHVSIIR